jgi:hypothetical protein
MLSINPSQSLYLETIDQEGLFYNHRLQLLQELYLNVHRGKHRFVGLHLVWPILENCRPYRLG